MRERGFLKKYKGKGCGKSLSARAGVGVESYLKMSRLHIVIRFTVDG